MLLTISVYENRLNDSVLTFLHRAFKQNKSQPDLYGKDSDLCDIMVNYMQDGCFWCLRDEKNCIYGTIGLRKIEDNCWEIRHFFIDRKYQGKGYGTKFLNKVLHCAAEQKITLIKAAIMEHCEKVQMLFRKAGFTPTARYNNSCAELFFKLELTIERHYSIQLAALQSHFKDTLILNPTENIPFHVQSFDTSFMEGLYVSDYKRDEKHKIIFGGRNRYVDLIDTIKSGWCEKLNAFNVDLKTLSGLHMHTILFMCVLHPRDTVLLLPEICGGHFSTKSILLRLGADVIEMVPDCRNLCVDQQKTKELVGSKHPRFIFVDRSEGLTYEDFSWLNHFKDSYKIFDASQYLSQILVNQYQNPFDMGFDMIVSTLHKNYPGPQKGLICVQDKTHIIWKEYMKLSGTYISNTHPENITASLLPLLDAQKFKQYTEMASVCCHLLEQELIMRNIPVVRQSSSDPKSMHIWILCNSQKDSYNYFLKLEEIGILTNYRFLPYNLKFGLRIGVNAAVRSGLKENHIPELASIMAHAYHEDISVTLEKQATRLIKKIKQLL